ncbi:MAG: DUF4147 domain-containing protein [Pirellulales bacterium]|nr:DUF4147 domain-containing protein [Pirellulales bacterium]
MTSPHRTADELREHAWQIWRAGVAGVDPRRLIQDAVQVHGDLLVVNDGAEEIELGEVNRIVVVGGGKAGAAMASALKSVLVDSDAARRRLSGLVCVPEDCLPTLRIFSPDNQQSRGEIELVAGRPAGVNEPTPAGEAAARRMLELVGSLTRDDLCLCLLSGGASALLPAPCRGFSLEDKLQLTRRLSAAGASIDQLNSVRRELSDFKGGGLADACRAGRMISLVVSDVPGDDLATIGCGPTADRQSLPLVAINVLREFGVDREPYGERAVGVLLDKHRQRNDARAKRTTRSRNYVIGNNAAAVDAAGIEAERLGYSHAMISATAPEGPAEEVGRRLASLARQMRDEPGPDCLIAGGEPTVRLPPPEVRGRGGRNQQLCLAALIEQSDWRGMALVSGGTDGEDGPTDAAGAFLDEPIAKAARRMRLDAVDALARCDAYEFFSRCDGLLKTGPTHTNVGDLRVVVVERRASESH